MGVKFKTGDPERIQIKDAIDKVIKGTWVLAPFQRPETWNWAQQKLLLDSLLQGIPIGVLYLWGFDKNKEIPCRGIPGIDFDKNKVHDLILDGQQRLSFLSWLKMKALDDNFKYGPGNVFFDSKTGEFSNSSKLEENLENGQILVHKLFQPGYKDEIDNALYNNRSSYSYEEYTLITSRINSIQTALTDRYIVCQILDKSEGIAESFKLYERVNQAGAKLKGDDYIEAALFGVWPDMYFKIKESVDILSKHPEDIKRDSFAEIFTRSNFIRSILDELYQIPNPTSRDKTPLSYLMNFEEPKYLNDNGDLKRLTKPILEKAFNDVKNAFQHFKEILVEDLYIYDSSGINPTFCIPVNTLLRKQTKNISALNKGKFIKWFILFHIHNKIYLGSQDKKIQEDCNAARLTHPFNSLENLLVERISYIDNTGDLKFRASMYGTPGKRVSSKLQRDFLFHMNLFLAINQGAKDWFTDRKIEKIKRERLVKHLVFPKSLYTKEEKSIVEHIGNVVTISKHSNKIITKHEPSFQRYLPDILIRDKNLLLNQQIPIDNKNLWNKNRITTFINKRIELLVQDLNILLDKLNNGTWEQKITIPNITDEHLVNMEEGQKLEFKETLVLMTKINKMSKDFPFVISKEVAGFMNNGGGTLFIGVKDILGSDRVVGLQRDFDLLSKNGENPKEAFQTILDNRLKTDLGRKNYDQILSRDFVEIDGKIIYKIVIPHVGDVIIKKYKIIDSDTGMVSKVWKNVLFVRRNDQTEPDSYINEKGVQINNF